VATDDETEFAAGAPDRPGALGIPRAGDIISGKYRVDRVIGVGGMGIVAAVTHLEIEAPYAIKFLLPKAAKDEETVVRFMREARNAVRIKSEHIARVSDVGRMPDGAPYILMEYLEGRDLGRVLAENGPLSPRDAVEYVLQACEGIAEAHALGIIHRDLKPANLFLTRRSDGAAFIKVLDFGISKAETDAVHRPALTETSQVFGSPGYMSPEQIRSAKNVDARSDVWSLGVILFELIAGRPPFVADTSGGLLSAIAADEPASLITLRPEISPELAAVIRKCLEKPPSKRFQSIPDLAEALDPFRSDTSIVSIGRMRRVSEAAPSMCAPLPESSRQPMSAPKAFASTDGPVTTSARSATRGRAIFLIAGALTGVVLVLAFYVRSTRISPPSAAPRPPPSTVARIAAPPPPSLEPPASAAAAPLSSTAKPKAPRRPLASATAATAAPPPIPTPPPPVPEGPKLDPTAESH
jgi:serine/threonine-protein kinase